MYVVSTPSGRYDTKEEAASLVKRINRNILLMLHDATNGVDVKSLIGPPDYAFTEKVAVMLAEVGVLVREPYRHKPGTKQAKLQNKSLPEEEQLVWRYAWGDKPFSACTSEQLDEVAWDLRHWSGFANIVHVEDEQKTAPETTSAT